jgi:hypothetical protein
MAIDQAGQPIMRNRSEAGLSEAALYPLRFKEKRSDQIVGRFRDYAALLQQRCRWAE